MIDDEEGETEEHGLNMMSDGDGHGDDGGDDNDPDDRQHL